MPGRPSKLAAAIDRVNREAARVRELAPAAPAARSHLESILAWESGELDRAETLALFGALIASGLVWDLQGCYGRTAIALMRAGDISPAGVVQS